MLHVARDDRRGDHVGCGRRSDLREEVHFSGRVIRDYLRSALTSAMRRLSRGAVAASVEGLRVDPVGERVAPSALTRGTLLRAVALPVVAARAQHDDEAAVGSLAAEPTKRKRRVDNVGHRRGGAARREVDRPATPCDDLIVVSRHQRDRPKARGSYPEPSSFLRGRLPQVAPNDDLREFSTGALKITRVLSDVYTYEAVQIPDLLT
jgi:hypothetical protein